VKLSNAKSISILACFVRVIEPDIIGLSFSFCFSQSNSTVLPVIRVVPVIISQINKLFVHSIRINVVQIETRRFIESNKQEKTGFGENTKHQNLLILCCFTEEAFYFPQFNIQNKIK
jgi:hypothetical protein